MGNVNRRLQSATTAAIVASLLMCVCGLTYRTLAARLESSATVAIAPDALESLPLRIADWTGVDVPMDDIIVRQTGTDAHVNRRYSRGSELVSLYIACGVRTRKLMQHRPDACYTGAGWTRTGRVLRDLSLNTGSVLPCVTLEFSRGGLNTERIIVVDYYIVDGQYCQTDSEWRYEYWRIGYVAQVQIMASVAENLTADEARRMVCDFATESAPLIAGQCEHIKTRKDDDSSREERERSGR
jgi:hypothetical protein